MPRPDPGQPRPAAIDRDIAAARRRALHERPFSAEWEAAIAELEGLERTKRRRELMIGPSLPRRAPALPWLLRRRPGADGSS